MHSKNSCHLNCPSDSNNHQNRCYFSYSQESYVYLIPSCYCPTNNVLHLRLSPLIHQMSLQRQNNLSHHYILNFPVL
ncbi:hypothetical protein EE612_045612 [Oryza sativa]|nr:hypothetical protein EE612_045612 [Oryza sativa]